jgi:hypothetical protein
VAARFVEVFVMHNLLRLTFVVTLLACVAAPALADTPSNAVYIRNTSKDSTLHFQFRCIGGTPRDYAIAPKTGYWLYNDNGCRHYTVLQLTSTNGVVTHTLKYDVNAGHRYEFFWDNDHAYWNMDAY